jgi:hypothetical protein
MTLATQVNILTFNHHESYLSSLAKTGYHFDVVTKRGRLDLTWNQRARPVPANIKLIEFGSLTKQKLRSGSYDVVICHTIKNLIWVWLYFKPHYVFVAHIPLFRDSFKNKIKSLIKKLVWRLFSITHRADFFAVSDFKRASWNEPGTVAVLAPDEFPPLKVGKRKNEVLIICNNLAARGDELGLGMIMRLQNKLTIKTIGNNPGIEFNIKPKDFSDFQELVTGFQIYLYTIKMPWGDGYNTAMLEAMRMGMAIVTVENPSSPIIHGVNGLIGRDEQDLINHINFLKESPSEVQRLGQAAQDTIQKHFSEAKFISAWRNVIDR